MINERLTFFSSSFLVVHVSAEYVDRTGILMSRNLIFFHISGHESDTLGELTASLRLSHVRTEVPFSVVMQTWEVTETTAVVPSG